MSVLHRAAEKGGERRGLPESYQPAAGNCLVSPASAKQTPGGTLFRGKHRCRRPPSLPHHRPSAVYPQPDLLLDRENKSRAASRRGCARSPRSGGWRKSWLEQAAVTTRTLARDPPTWRAPASHHQATAEMRRESYAQSLRETALEASTSNQSPARPLDRFGPSHPVSARPVGLSSGRHAVETGRNVEFLAPQHRPRDQDHAARPRHHGAQAAERFFYKDEES